MVKFETSWELAPELYFFTIQELRVHQLLSLASFDLDFDLFLAFLDEPVIVLKV